MTLTLNSISMIVLSSLIQAVFQVYLDNFEIAITFFSYYIL